MAPQKFAIAAAAAVIIAALPALAAGDAAHGKRIAQRWCASCHLVTDGQKRAMADAPSFADIAHRREDAKALANFLVDPHPKMPDMHLSRREIDDIVSYIRSLDPRPRPPEPGIDKDDRPRNG
ncbi:MULTISPECIES: c-type cytochrome [Methylosinus]|uniref:Cytochrome C n=1 Tax=Methylosinus trichosporium (strain ATCC 35070 / NCIMB 11131 / UNIQEM 75 / OB3b) TaxID=595536 RepID=A0A2D2D3E5_METT3|nr:MULTISPECIES: cytochrome c [Methylosinus]ATQ69518.1 cytochrome C [Methylosinus trichosporium OB3b]OBS50518.1 cytochrome C [Methylosinus sp. 3S-1]